MEKIESLDNFNIYSFCRTCLKNTNDFEVHNDIFTIPDLKMKLAECTYLPVEPDDGFPTILCETCFIKVDEFYIFQQMCISSRKRFQDYLHSERKPCSTIDANNAPAELMMSIEVKKENEEEDSVYLNQYSELGKEEFAINVKDESKYSSNEKESEESQYAECKTNVKEDSAKRCNRMKEIQETYDPMAASDPSNIHPDSMMLTEAETEVDPISLDQFSVKEECSLNVEDKITHSSNEEESKESRINTKDNSSKDCGRIKEIEKQSDGMVRSTGRKTTRKKKLECKICKKRFRIIGKLEVHMRQHQGLKPFPCHFCKKSYSRRDTLKYHMQDKHKGKLPFTETEFSTDSSNIQTQAKEGDPNSVDQFSEVDKEEFLSNEKKREESQLNAESKINVNENSSEIVTGILSRIKEINDSSDNMVRASNHNNTLNLECEICNQIFKKADKLERHLRLHKGLKPFPCLLCDKSYSRRNRMNLHIQEKHNGKITSTEPESGVDSSNTPEDFIGFTEAQQKIGEEEVVKEEYSVSVMDSSNVKVLEKCEAYVERKTSLEANSSNDCGGLKETIDSMATSDPSNIPPHLLMLKRVKKENNEEDPISFNRFPEIVKQEFSEIVKEEFSINAIDQVKNSPNEEESEEMQPHDEYKKNIHQNSNNNGDGIKKNKKTCHKTKHRLKCEICKKCFKKAENLEMHMRVHQGLKPFSCQFCERSYSRKNTLRKHICINKRAHKKPKKPRNTYVCEQCGKVLATAATLKNHCYLHTGQELPYECPRCQKRYITRSLLRRHMDRHACKNLICPHCGAKRKTQKDLKRHINTHTKEKGYPCELCSMVFYSNGKLNKHKRAVHEDIKDFPCLYCDKSFGTAESRKHHEIVHTGEKPFACDTCNKKFSRIITLRRHQKVHLIAEN